MIMFKSVGVLLAVSAMVALVQSNDDSASGPGAIEFNRDACIAYAATQLANIKIQGTLMNLVRHSRNHYSSSLVELVKGTPTSQYKQDMLLLGSQSSQKDCDTLHYTLWEIYEDDLCKEFIDRHDIGTFMLSLANFSLGAKTSIEAYYACFYAGEGDEVQVQTQGLVHDHDDDNGGEVEVEVQVQVQVQGEGEGQDADEDYGNGEVEDQ